jgi:hypothetical protein
MNDDKISVLELLLSASYTANSSNKALSKQVNYDDDVLLVTMSPTKLLLFS